MASVILRPATSADSEFAYQARAAAFREYVEDSFGWQEDQERERHERRFAQHDYRVAEVDGTPVGILAVAREPETVHLHQLFILPEHQGRGIGRACVERVLSEASPRPVRLRVLDCNPRALSFYERLGFRRVGGTERHVILQHP